MDTGLLPNEYDPDYQARRQLAIMNALRNAPQAPKAQMVGGQYIRPHWSQGIAAAIGQWGAMKGAADAEDQSQVVSQRATDDYEKWMKDRPQAQQVNLPGPQPEELQGVPLTGVKEPTADDRLNWAMKGTRNPLSKALATQYASDLLIKEPERQEARQFKADESAATRQAAVDAAKQKTVDRLEELKVRLEDRGLDRESREKMAAEARALQQQLAGMADATRRYAIDSAAQNAASQQQIQKEIADMRFNAAKDKPPKPLPAAQSQAWIGNQVSLRKVDAALDDFIDPKTGQLKDSAHQHVGAKYAIPGMEWVGQKTDPEGVPMRARVADIGSLKIHDRSGAAVTASESPRLRPFIPTAYDGPQAIADKLKNFRKEYTMMQEEIENYADNQGYINPGAGPKGGSAGALPKSTGNSKVVNGKTYVNVNGQWFEQ
jgi:hypothetical protein